MAAWMSDQPLVVTGMPEEVYHSIPRFSASILADFAVDEYEGEKALAGDGFEASMDMLFGKALHAAVLEPERFEREAVFDDDIGPGSIVKMRKAMAKAPKGVMILAGCWRDHIAGIAERFKAHPILCRLLGSKEQSEAVTEISLFWTEVYNGQRVLCKARLDWWSPKWQAIIDFKTTGSAIRIDFERRIGDQKYMLKAAWYLRGVVKTGLSASPSFGWIAAENKPPYRVHAYEPDPEGIERGWGECAHALSSMIAYLDRGHIQPPPPKFIKGVDAPPYLRVDPASLRSFIAGFDTDTTEGATTWTLEATPRYSRPDSKTKTC